MQCGHTVCLKCVKPDASGKRVICPSCGEDEDMPVGGMVNLPRDWIAAQQAAMDRVTKSGGVQCRHSDGSSSSCEEMATRTCFECGNGVKKVHLCEVHAQQHRIAMEEKEGKQHTMKPIDVAAAGMADMTVTCLKHPGWLVGWVDGWHVSLSIHPSHLIVWLQTRR